eukprot:s2323_g2.t1
MIGAARVLRQRDTLAAPLRDLEACILAVRTGTFLPDVSRSGYFPSGAVAQNVAPSDEPSETPPGRTGASDIEPSVGMTWPDDTAADPLDSQADSPIFGEGHELEHPAASPSLAADEDAEGADKISASSSSSSLASTESDWTVHLLPEADAASGVRDAAASTSILRISRDAPFGERQLEPLCFDNIHLPLLDISDGGD